MRVYQTCDDCVVRLVPDAPEFATVGAPYPVEIVITARKECADVVVNKTRHFLAVPSLYEAIHQQLQVLTAHSVGNSPHMKQGEAPRICVWMRPTKEGCCLAAATVCACPNCVLTQIADSQQSALKKYGPQCACLYCPISYTIEVCNSGSATAYDVVVQDAVPDGLTHSTGYNMLTYNLGDMCPGDSKTLCIDFCAAKAGPSY